MPATYPNADEIEALRKIAAESPAFAAIPLTEQRDLMERLFLAWPQIRAQREAR